MSKIMPSAVGIQLGDETVGVDGRKRRLKWVRKWKVAGISFADDIGVPCSIHGDPMPRVEGRATQKRRIGGGCTGCIEFHHKRVVAELLGAAKGSWNAPAVVTNPAVAVPVMYAFPAASTAIAVA